MNVNLPQTELQTVPLYRAAHSRTGDKGNRSNISVIVYRPELFDLLVSQVTEAAVAAHFAHRQPSSVVRHILPALGAMNFVLDAVLDGGVNDALNLDSHGKALSFWLLDLPVRILSGGKSPQWLRVGALAEFDAPSREVLEEWLRNEHFHFDCIRRIDLESNEGRLVPVT